MIECAKSSMLVWDKLQLKLKAMLLGKHVRLRIFNITYAINNIKKLLAANIYSRITAECFPREYVKWRLFIIFILLFKWLSRGLHAPSICGHCTTSCVDECILACRVTCAFNHVKAIYSPFMQLDCLLRMLTVHCRWRIWDSPHGSIAYSLRNSALMLNSVR